MFYKAINKEVNQCQWFVNCVRDAVVYVEHPILGQVPCCQQCADFVNGNTKEQREVLS